MMNFILDKDLDLDKALEKIELTILATNGIFTGFIDILPHTFTRNVCISN